MSKIEVLVINGSPGSGKSTIANALSEELRKLNQVHAVIDVDELARVYPETQGDLMWRNLAAIWENYRQIEGMKAILPVCIDDQEALDKLKASVPCDTFTICELVAPVDILKSRVTEREPNDYWQGKLRDLVQRYADRPEKFSDFQVSTERSSVENTAKEIVAKLGWLN